MSEASEAAHIYIQMADFINHDGARKLNIVGGGINILGLQPTIGTTTGFHVLGRVEVPSRVCPVECAIGLMLVDANNDVVVIPGTDSKLRFAQIQLFEKPQVPGVLASPELCRSHNLILGFAAGLPLQVGSHFSWILRVDNDVDHQERLEFAVAGPPPPPVLG
jgi:hypothetical protein